MEDVKIILSALWITIMLTFLLGDVMRIMSGESTLMARAITQGMWLPIAILMVIPEVMIVLSLTVAYPVNRLANIIVAIFWFVFNLLGLSTYPSAYSKFLLIASMGFNVLTVWYAWKWVKQEAS